MIRRYLVQGFLTLGLVLGVAPAAWALNYTYISLDVPGSVHNSANGINDSGLVVGEYGFNDPDPTIGLRVHGYLYDGVTYTPINYPGVEWATVASGINDSSMVVGGYIHDGAGQPSHGFLYDAGADTYAHMDFPGASSSSASDINDSGQIVGGYRDATGSHGYLYDGTYTTLDVTGASTTSPSGINDLGVIVGSYTDAGGNYHGYLYDGAYTSLDVPGASETWATGINNLGQVVGWYRDGGGSRYLFLYDGTDFTPLNIDYPGFDGESVHGINDSGWIVGRYWDGPGFTGADHGFLAIPAAHPIPEPSTFLLLGVGLAGLGLWGRKKLGRS